MSLKLLNNISYPSYSINNRLISGGQLDALGTRKVRHCRTFLLSKIKTLFFKIQL